MLNSYKIVQIVTTMNITELLQGVKISLALLKHCNLTCGCIHKLQNAPQKGIRILLISSL